VSQANDADRQIEKYIDKMKC